MASVALEQIVTPCSTVGDYKSFSRAYVRDYMGPESR